MASDASDASDPSGTRSAHYGKYVFSPDFFRVAPELLEDFPRMPPALLQPGGPLAVAPKPPQLFLGAAGSGANMHWHADAWNGLAWGARRWVLCPPDAAVYSSKPAGLWLEEDYSQGDAQVSGCLEVIQQVRTAVCHARAGRGASDRCYTRTAHFLTQTWPLSLAGLWVAGLLRLLHLLCCSTMFMFRRAMCCSYPATGATRR
jgi:hypothetical protein